MKRIVVIEREFAAGAGAIAERSRSGWAGNCSTTR